MARTIAEIKQQILETKNNNQVLQELDSNSSTSIWQLWADIVALVIYTLESLFDLFKIEINSIVSSSLVGSSEWYRSKALEFQLGNNLVFMDNTYKYPDNTDGTPPTGTIIKRASAEEINGIVHIKVAKEDSGLPVPLSNIEKEAFTSYMNKIRFAGVFLSIVSKSADLFKLDLIVYYDPQLITSEGKSVANLSVYPVIEAIDAYAASLPWNGRMYVQQLVDAIQSVSGVLDITIDEIQVSTSDGSYSVLQERYYTTNAGYIKFNSAGSIITYNTN